MFLFYFRKDDDRAVSDSEIEVCIKREREERGGEIENRGSKRIKLIEIKGRQE